MINTVTSLFAAANECAKGTFFGLVPWYQYLEYGKDPELTAYSKCTVLNFTLLGTDSDLPLILLAVVDDLLRIAGIVAVMFVIYGGVMYVTSQGNPDQASKAQSTIINALIGLSVAIVAVVFVTFLGRTLSS